MIKSKIAWLLLVAAFAAGLVFVRFNFTKANSIVNIRITMDRNESLRQAAALKARYAWGPAAARSATVFDLDGRLETFVELEAGGKEAFNRMLKGTLLSPYAWRVRFFREGEVNETQVEFTPAGRPYGFSEHLSETAPGPTLVEPDARAIAERAARADWGAELDAFRPVETSLEVQPGGRVDHIFVYERQRETVGEGRYRLRLVVSGDRLTQLSHFLKIPESFDRRYEQMRSANETIATAASFTFYILYFGAGCLGGLFFLLRRRYLRWKPALIAGLVVALLGALSEINSLPIAWMEYDTAESARVFVAHLLAGVLMSLVMSTFVLSITFMVAEGLTRRAFSHLIQFWKIWRPSAAASPDVGGQTAIGFLMVGLLVAYDVAVYLVGNNWLGWWTPSDTLVDPNILGLYLPWLTPAANALHAGFWEECLFRAVPLSCAALIGARIGRPRRVMGIALVAQAIIFGAAHANYPNQPAYARIVEIAPAFLVFGLIYLRFGLLPVIVAHFGVDMAYMSLPIFFTETDRIWIDRLIAVLLFAVPLLAVLAAAAVRRGWNPISAALLNRAWQPAAAPVEAPETVAPSPLPVRSYSARAAAAALALGAAALAAWACLSDFNPHADRLALTRVEARDAGRRALAERGFMPTGTWEATTAVLDEQAQPERYVWQERGPAVYDRVQRMRNLSTPAWHVRLARFDGAVDVAERAEVFGVVLCGTGEVTRAYHELPEARPGVEMTQEEARERAKGFLERSLHVDTSALKEVATKPAKKPNRTDWVVTLAFTNMAAFTNHEVEIAVSLADGAVVDCLRGFHTPEKWARDEQAKMAVFGIVTLVCSLLVRVLFIAGMIAGIVGWSRGRFAADVFFKASIAFAVFSLLGLANGWPAHLAEFSTAQPWASQCLQTLARQIIPALLIGPIAALLLAGSAARARGEGGGAPGPWDLAVALGVGLCVASLSRLAALWTPEWQPQWPQLDAADAYVPFLQVPLEALGLFMLRASFAVFVLCTLNRLTPRAGWRPRLPLLLAVGMILAGRHEVRGLAAWLGSGILLGAVLLAANEVFFRRRLHLVPAACSAFQSVDAIRQAALNGYAGAMPANALAVAAVLWMGWLYSRWLAGGAPRPARGDDGRRPAAIGEQPSSGRA